MNRLRTLLSQAELVRFVLSMGSRFGSTLLSFIVLFVASHSMDTAEYGLYIFLFSVGSSLGLIFVFGQQVLLVKHYRLDGHAKGKTNQDILFANACWLAFGVGILLVAAAVLQPFADQLPSPYHALPIAFIFAAVFALSEYFQNYFRIHGQIALALAPRENIWRILCAVALPALAYGGYLHSGATATAIVTLLLGLTVSYQFIRFYQAEGFSYLSRQGSKVSAESWRIWNRETGFFSANSFFTSAAGYFETILIGLVLDLQAAAVYFVAYRISMLLTLPVLAIDTVGIPLISARFQTNDTQGAQRITAILSAGSFLCALIGGVFLYFTGSFVLEQFDPDFGEHFSILVVMSLAAISSAFFGPGTWLIMIGHGERYLLIARSLVFVFYLGILFLFGIKFGLLGVAIASWIQVFVINMLARHWVIQRWSVDNAATSIFTVFTEWRRVKRAAAQPAKEASDAPF